MNINIFGVGGCARSGKDTFAAFAGEVISNYKVGANVVKINLADKLKEMYCAENGIGIEQLLDVRTKEIHRPGLIKYGAKKRLIDRNFWVRKLVDYFWNYKFSRSKDSYLFVPDVRYLSEFNLPAILMAEAPKNIDTLRVKFHAIYIHCPEEILRKRFSSDEVYEATVTDASETSLGPDDFGVVMNNNYSDLVGYRKAVDLFVAEHRI